MKTQQPWTQDDVTAAYSAAYRMSDAIEGGATSLKTKTWLLVDYGTAWSPVSDASPLNRLMPWPEELDEES